MEKGVPKRKYLVGFEVYVLLLVLEVTLLTIFMGVPLGNIVLGAFWAPIIVNKGLAGREGMSGKGWLAILLSCVPVLMTYYLPAAAMLQGQVTPATVLTGGMAGQMPFPLNTVLGYHTTMSIGGSVVKALFTWMASYYYAKMK